MTLHSPGHGTGSAQKNIDRVRRFLVIINANHPDPVHLRQVLQYSIDHAERLIESEKQLSRNPCVLREYVELNIKTIDEDEFIMKEYKYLVARDQGDEEAMIILIMECPELSKLDERYC